MNTYYSNLIEGHDTRPRDIERALAGDFDNDDDDEICRLKRPLTCGSSQKLTDWPPNGACPNLRLLISFVGSTGSSTETPRSPCSGSPARVVI